MGFESFRVELRGGSATYRETEETIRKIPHVKLDPQSLAMKGSMYSVVGDRQHVLEVELRDVPLRLSCRFTLCHPPSVDSVFLRLLHDLMLRFGMEVKIGDDVRPEHTHLFSLADYAELSFVTLHYIAERRAEWIAAFGGEQMAATTNEVHERIILPRCQPLVASPEKE